MKVKSENEVTQSCPTHSDPMDRSLPGSSIYGIFQARVLEWVTSADRYTDDTTLMAESEEEPKSLLMKVKEENKKVGLKLNIQKMKIMASGPITSWEIDGDTVETVSDFILGGSKITAVVIAAMKLKDTHSLEGKL